MTSQASLSLSLSLSLLLTKVTHAQYRKRFRVSYNEDKRLELISVKEARVALLMQRKKAPTLLLSTTAGARSAPSAHLSQALSSGRAGLLLYSFQ